MTREKLLEWARAKTGNVVISTVPDKELAAAVLALAQSAEEAEAKLAEAERERDVARRKHAARCAELEHLEPALSVSQDQVRVARAALEAVKATWTRICDENNSRTVAKTVGLDAYSRMWDLLAEGAIHKIDAADAGTLAGRKK